MIQGTVTGTITDVEGNFKLASVTKGAVMEISFIGYISKTLQVKDASSLKIVLKEDNQALDEVVVVGYGVQRKSDLQVRLLQLTRMYLKVAHKLI